MYVQTGGVEICVLLPVDCGNLFIHVGRLGDSICWLVVVGMAGCDNSDTELLPSYHHSIRNQGLDLQAHNSYR